MQCYTQLLKTLLLFIIIKIHYTFRANHLLAFSQRKHLYIRQLHSAEQKQAKDKITIGICLQIQWIVGQRIYAELLKIGELFRRNYNALISR